MIEQIYKEQITQSIKNVEKNSDAEMICVVSDSAINHEIFGIYMALAITFIIAFGLLFVKMIDKFALFEISVISFFLLKILFSYNVKILNFLIPKIIKFRLTYELAQKNFWFLGYGNCENSVMFFVSLEEKIAHVICGKRVSEFVQNSDFSVALEKFLETAKSKNIGEATLFGVERIGELLIEKFPNTLGEKDEISHTFVEVKNSKFRGKK